MKRIAIHSVPRSGSSWLGQIFNSVEDVTYKYQPLFSYSFKDALNERSSRLEIVEFFREISACKDSFLDQTDRVERGDYPVFSKVENMTSVVYKEVRYHHLLDNMLKKDQELKVVGLVRKPQAVINSWLNAPREFRRDLGWQELEEWRFASKKNLARKEEFNGFEKWKEVAYLFLQLLEQFPDRFYLQQYEKLNKSTIAEVGALFQFLNLDFDSQTVEFISRSKNTMNVDPYSVFRKEQNDEKWKSQLHPEIIRAIENDLKHTRLECFL